MTQKSMHPHPSSQADIQKNRFLSKKSFSQETKRKTWHGITLHAIFLLRLLLISSQLTELLKNWNWSNEMYRPTSKLSSSQSSQDLFFWHSQPIHTFAEINGGFNDQLLLSWEHQLKVKLEKIKIDSDYDDRLNGGETDFRCRWSDLLRFIDIYALIWFWSRVRCVFMLWNVDDRMIQAKCLLCLEHLGIRWRDSECQDTTSRPIIFVKKENLKNITKHIELL